VLRLLRSLLLQFRLKLLPSTVLTLHQVHLTLLVRLLFLGLNHVLHVASTLLLLLPLFVVAHPGHLLLSLGLERHVPLFVDCVHFAVVDCLVSNLLVSFVTLAFHFFIHALLLVTLLFRLRVHHVALALRDDLSGTFASLINFLVNLALFHFEQTDPIAQQLQILFGALASKLCSAELFVKSVVIVIFIGH